MLSATLKSMRFYACLAGISLLAFFFLLAAASAQEKHPPLPPGLSGPLAEALYLGLTSGTLPQSGSDKWHSDALVRFYDRRNYEPVWLDAQAGVKRNPEPFIHAFSYSLQEGLHPRDYRLQAIASAPLARTLPAFALRELRMTNAVLHYLNDLSSGRINPNKVFPKLFLPNSKRDLAYLLERALEMQTEALPDYFASVAPQHPEYQKLKQALAQYRQIDKQEGWEPIASGGLIRPGDSDPRLPAIRERLQFLGWLPDADFDRENSYDSITEQAVRTFQEYRGAKVDGVIGPETLGQLNVPLRERIRQIVLTMERWRWLPDDLGEKYLMVNIAGFYATGVKNGQTVVQTPVIVGEVAHQTPNFSSHITDVKFYPDWTVPHSIAKRYLLRKIQNNPNLIQALGYELYEGNKHIPWENVVIEALSPGDFPPLRFRQKPGLGNALGLVRFSIANDYSIYLHDTPDDSLFERDTRTFSSGCIRVGKPVQLALFILEESQLSADEIRRKFNVTPGQMLKTHIVPLSAPLPTYLVYMTAWFDEQGVLHFGQDVYGRDAKLLEALMNDE